MKYIDIAWDWLVWSSANPDRLSLTLKGIIGGAATLLTLAFGVGHVIPSDMLGGAVSDLIVAIQAIVGTLSAVSIAIGSLRKLWLTFTGKNQAIQ